VAYWAYLWNKPAKRSKFFLDFADEPCEPLELQTAHRELDGRCVELNSDIAHTDLERQNNDFIVREACK
jgi:hypothetical protein